MFKDKDEAEQFVEEHFNRLSRNRWERYKRMIRRGYTNRWNYFCTYTYDSEKHTEETFRQSLMVDGEIIGKISPEVIEKMPKAN